METEIPSEILRFVGVVIIALVALGLFAFAVVVLPLTHSKAARPTLSKVVATGVAIGVCAYWGSLLPAVVFLWPLSLIWFPEYWADYTRPLQGTYIHRKSPPALIAAFGWLFMVLFTVLVMWIYGQ